MTVWTRSLIGLAFLAVLTAGGMALLHNGLYGLTIFILIPVLLGGLVAWVFRPTSGWHAIRMGAAAAALAAGSLVFLGAEGLICTVMTLPLAVPLGALGSWLVYISSRSTVPRTGMAMILLLSPASINWDATARPPVFAVHTAIIVAAPPEKVWQHMVSFADLPEPREWYFRAGIAYTKRARIVGAGPGAVRYCEFSTGPFVEPIEVWNEPRLLRFRVTANPAPLEEWSPYAHITPKHLHGYLVSRQGEFRLTPLADQRTLLEGTTWYQHGLWPAPYWRWWSDAIIHRIHQRVLNHIRMLAEQR